MLIKIICIAMTTIIVSSIIKQYRSDIALLINISGALIIVMLSLGELNSVINEVLSLESSIDVGQTIVPVAKVVGIGYITEFCSDLAEDSGNKMIGSKILLGGKIAICAVALPIIKNMLSVILSLVR